MMNSFSHCHGEKTSAKRGSFHPFIFSLFGRYVEVEVRTPTGRVDIVMKTAKVVYVFELKLNMSAQVAMKQIALKDYSSKFALSGLPIVKIGINFDPERRTIGDWKVCAHV